MSNRIPIPRDLMPGDIIVDAKGDRHVFKCYSEPMPLGRVADRQAEADCEDGCIFVANGQRWFRHYPHAVEIIRKYHIVDLTQTHTGWVNVYTDHKGRTKLGKVCQTRQEARKVKAGGKIRKCQITLL